MTLKLYFTNDAPGYTPGARAASFGWNRITGFVTRKLSTGKGTGGNTSVTNGKTVSTTSYDVLHGTWVSDPIVRSLTITPTDTIGFTIGRYTASASTFYSMMCIWFTVGDSDTVRAIWRTGTGSNFWGTAGPPGGNAGWSHGGAAADFTVQPGDRLIIEQGVRDTTTATTRTATLYYGDGGGADYTLGTNLTTGADTMVGNAELIGAPELLWTPLAPTAVPVTDSGASSDTATLAVITSQAATDSGTGADAASVVTIPTPGQIYDLSRWHLTLPTEDPGPATDAAQIDQPALATYTDPNFYTDDLRRMVFVAPVIGATTSGESGATRSEGREHESDYSNSAWDPRTTGRRQFTITTRVDGTSIAGGTLPRQEVICYQIHGASGTPPLYLTAEWTSSGNPISTPRIRVFLSGTGMSNFNAVTGITPDTDITIRCRVENALVKLWVVIGQVTDLAPLNAPQWQWNAADFTDLSSWYFKAGAYNKTTIASGSTGQAVAKVSYWNLLQPGDPDPVAVEPGRMLLALP